MVERWVYKRYKKIVLELYEIIGYNLDILKRGYYEY